MSGFESLMWELERDPRLSSAFANLTILDRPPDRSRFRERMAAASLSVPRLRQRVEEPRVPWDTPRWVEDPDFDIDHHLRWVHLGDDGDRRSLYDLAAALMRQPFDRERPLWEFVTIEGLDGGRAAMLQRLHHTITDGEGGIRLSIEFIDFERDPRPKGRSESVTGGESVPGGGADDLSHAVEPTDIDTSDGHSGAAADSDSVTNSYSVTNSEAPHDPTGEKSQRSGDDSPRSWWVWPITAMGDAASAVTEQAAAVPRVGDDLRAVVRSTVRQVAVGSFRSPLWKDRSLERHLETTTLSLDDVRAAAKSLGGSVNDLFITGAAAAAGRLHRAAGAPVDELRVSMPVSTRHDRAAGGNAFSPTQTLVPTGEMACRERFEQIHRILSDVKNERVIDKLEGAANFATLLPSAAVVRSGQHLAGSVDFVCSNVRAAPFDLFMAGSLLEANYPLGPLAGTAFNLTTMSYRGWLYLGLVTDPAAIGNPVELLDEIEAAYAELLHVGGVHHPRNAPAV